MVDITARAQRRLLETDWTGMERKSVPRFQISLLMLMFATAALACYMDRLFDLERNRLAVIKEIEDAGGSVVIDDDAGFALFRSENVVAVVKCVPFDPNSPSDFDHIDLIANAQELQRFRRLSKLTVSGFATRMHSQSQFLAPGAITIPSGASKFLSEHARTGTVK